MPHYIDIQNVTSHDLFMNDEEIRRVAHLALRDLNQEVELTIRFVSQEEITFLNGNYRKKDNPTNVLAFPSELPPQIQLDIRFIGDIIICPDILLLESNTLSKTLDAHWSLILIHGILHLLGYDHIKDEEAEIMQAVEIQLLAELGYANPYEEAEDNLF